MLGYEDGMIPHRGLLPIVGRPRRGQSLGDKVLGVLLDNRSIVPGQIRRILRVQPKTLAESRSLQIGKQCVQFLHCSEGGPLKLFNGGRHLAVAVHAPLHRGPTLDQPAIDGLNLGALLLMYVSAHR